MKIDEIKNYLSQLKENPELLDEDSSIIEMTINDIIRAEKKYSYGLGVTTQQDRQEEIEKIILNAIERNINENKKN
ncbi:hypothetical protein WB66_01615 [bacteria symbiont BFo1 of Frankliniella occidentalis]|nr:hypothetical protein AI28_25605 [bacteria symbiont BFo1 of Frankliniella occidentalis]KYP86726.1 hypothetical protein WB66_01615 [bacteria symbiont BFo1 of Frankliniella occidentalis]